MKKLFALRKKNQELLEKAQKIVELADSESRDITEDEQNLFGECMDESTKLEAQIKSLEVLEAKLKAMPAVKDESDELTDQITDPKPNILDDPKRGFRTMGEFAIAVKKGSMPGAAIDDRLRVLAAATGLNYATGSDGGFLVPPEFSTTVYDGVIAASQSLVGLCDSYTVTGESLTFPANAETSRATGSRWGGVRAYWLSEAAQITASKPTLRQVKIEPQQMGVLVYTTDKLLNNAEAVDQWITRSATDEIAFATGEAIINGDGVGKPLGIMNGGCLVSVAKEISQTAATLTATNINKMWARLPAASWGRAVWLINQDVWPEFDGLNIPKTDVGGTGTVVGFTTGIYNAANMTLKNRPIIPVEYCATLGTTGDIILADMQAYLVGLRNGVQSATSMHLRFDYAETAFRFIYEIDGQPWLISAITPFKGSNTQSPFVKLDARG